jgi:hypothetical protein
LRTPKEDLLITVAIYGFEDDGLVVAYGAGKAMAKLCVEMMMYCPSLSLERKTI